MSKQKKNTLSTLPKIKPKKFNPEEFLETATKVQQILKEEQEQYIKEKLKNINEDSHPFIVL